LKVLTGATLPLRLWTTSARRRKRRTKVSEAPVACLDWSKSGRPRLIGSRSAEDQAGAQGEKRKRAVEDEDDEDEEEDD